MDISIDKGYVYLMYDTKDWEKSSPIYIGSTKCKEKRLYQHFYKLKNGNMTEKEYNSVEIIRYVELPTLADARILERYLIGKESPTGSLFNIKFMNEGVPTLDIDISRLEFKTILKNDLIENINVRTKSKGAIKLEKNFLRYLEGCILIAHTGYSHILFYDMKKDCKEIVFVSKNNTEECDALYAKGIKLFSEELFEAFILITKKLQIPWTYEHLLYYDNKEKEFLKQEIDKYIDNYKGINFDPFYGVRLKGSSSLGEKLFDDEKSAIIYADKLAKKYSSVVGVYYITKNFYDEIYTVNCLRSNQNCDEK